jgi:hypothetical protein
MNNTLQRTLAVIRSFGDEMPVPVERMVETLNLGPDYRPLGDGISGKIVRAPDDRGAGYRIVVNAHDHQNRQRFTVAHELGHYIYHRDLLDSGVGDTVAYRAEGSGFPNPRIGPAQETEANRFASNLLMPNRLIAKLQAEGVRDPMEMARRLGVSESAMRIKLGLPAKLSLFG